MGDNVLKRSSLLIALSCVLFAGDKDVNLSWVDQEIEAIKPARKGISEKVIALLEDPFVFLEKNKTKKEKKKKTAQAQLPPAVSVTGSPLKTGLQPRNFKLMAVINDAAFINGKWYNIGANIGGYKLVKITMNEVTLKGPDKTFKLTTDTKKLKVGRNNEKDEK